MWPRLRGVALWIYTGLDDVFVERFWKRLRRGEVAAAFRTFPDILLGFWGCSLAALVAMVVVVALVVV